MYLLYVTERKQQKRVVVLMEAWPVHRGNVGRDEGQVRNSGVRFARDGKLLPWHLAANLTACRAKGGVLQEAVRLSDESAPETRRQANTRPNNRSASTGIQERVDPIN